MQLAASAQEDITNLSRSQRERLRRTLECARPITCRNRQGLWSYDDIPHTVAGLAASVSNPAICYFDESCSTRC